MKYEKEYKLFLDTWGLVSQIDIAIEEMAELITALSKYKRLLRVPKNHAGREKEYLDNIREEIADASLCIEQMTMHFGKEEIDQTREEKVQRVMKKYFPD